MSADRIEPKGSFGIPFFIEDVDGDWLNLANVIEIRLTEHLVEGWAVVADVSTTTSIALYRCEDKEDGVDYRDWLVEQMKQAGVVMIGSVKIL